MILYQPNGKAFVLSPVTWRAALEQAQSAGWQPSGTLPPPTDLEKPPALWPGVYEPAVGQQVSRPDALALASALKRVLAANPHSSHAFQVLADFCCSGGFLICSSPGIADSLANLAEPAGTSFAVPTVAPASQALPRHSGGASDAYAPQ